MPFSSRILFWSKHPWGLVLKAAGVVYRRFHPMEPWISFQAARYLAETLNSRMNGLEWGSGRSTIWFARHLGRLTSVEHHTQWHEYVKGQLAEKKIQNVDYRLIPLDHPVEAPTPAHYDPLPKYVEVAKEFPDGSLDFVLIDGHYRQSCVTAALPKIKSGGLLAIDNSNWMPLAEWGVPADWPIKHRSFGFDSETTVWQKPN